MAKETSGKGKKPEGGKPKGGAPSAAYSQAAKSFEKRPPGRPPSLGGGTGANELLALRLPVDLLKRVDKWRKAQADNPARSEAARRLLESALERAGH